MSTRGPFPPGSGDAAPFLPIDGGAGRLSLSNTRSGGLPLPLEATPLPPVGDAAPSLQDLVGGGLPLPLEAALFLLQVAQLLPEPLDGTIEAPRGGGLGVEGALVTKGTPATEAADLQRGDGSSGSHTRSSTASTRSGYRGYTDSASKCRSTAAVRPRR